MEEVKIVVVGGIVVTLGGQVVRKRGATSEWVGQESGEGVVEGGGKWEVGESVSD